MLRQSFFYAKQMPPAQDRVLPHQSLTKGVEEASAQRTTDLTTEYVELKPYFDAMQNLKANFDLATFRKHLTQAFPKEKKVLTKSTNLEKVLNQLVTIGVLSKKERKDEVTWSVAFMYRSGLSVKGAGLN
jgi:hypothetical protein